MTRKKRDVKGDTRSGSAAIYPYCKDCGRKIEPGEQCVSYVSMYLKRTMYICSECAGEGAK